MKTTPNCGIIGYGPVNQGLVPIFHEKGWNLKWISRKAGLFSSELVRLGPHEAIFAKEQSHDLDVVFLAIPSAGNGAEGLKLARHFLQQRIAVVTAEKAIQACRPGALRRYRERFGCSASVGGNADVLNFIARDPFGVTGIIGVSNTSLNFVRYLIASGLTYEQAIAKAIKLKFMESGDLQAEVRDLLLKGVILRNQITNFIKPVSFGELKPRALSVAKIRLALELDYVGLVEVRLISDKPAVNPVTEFIPDLTICRCRRNGWELRVFFQNTRALPFSAPTGDRNIFLLTNSVGEKYAVSGQGAGVRITAGTMISQACEILGIRE